MPTWRLCYLCTGQGGVIVAGRGRIWNQVSNDLTREQFWGGCRFRDRVLVATQCEVYEVTLADQLVKLSPLDVELASSGWLCCNNDVVWSIGSEHLFWSRDADRWNQVFIN